MAKKLWQWSWRVGISLAFVWVAAVAALDAYGQRDQAQPADVIILLGAQVHPGGVAGPALTRRTQHAVALYQQGLAPIIVCAGGVGEVPPAEAEVACNLAEQLGVPRAALRLEATSRSTEENALNTTTLAQTQGWHTAIIVSDGFHLYRAHLLFDRAGLLTYPSPAQITAGPMPLVERVGRLSRELAALGWYWGKTAVGWQQTDFP